MSYSEILEEIGTYPKRYGQLLAFNKARSVYLEEMQGDKMKVGNRKPEDVDIETARKWAMKRSNANKSNIASGTMALKRKYGNDILAG